MEMGEKKGREKRKRLQVLSSCIFRKKEKEKRKKKVG